MKIDRLREICGKATPGPWFGGFKPDRGAYRLTIIENATEQGWNTAIWGKDIQFIATFNPALVSRLLDVVEAAKSYIDFYEPQESQASQQHLEVYSALKALEQADETE